MKKRVVALITVALALVGCGSLIGPDDASTAASAARAKQALEAASHTVTAPSHRLSSN